MTGSASAEGCQAIREIDTLQTKTTVEGKCTNGEAYNFGPRAEQTKTVFELTQDLAKLWGLDPDKAAKLTGDVPFEDLPDDWKCPRCRQGKEKFNRA